MKKNNYAFIAFIIISLLGFIAWKNISRSQNYLPQLSPPVNNQEINRGELNISVCDPSNGVFSLDINNPYLPYPVGQMQILEDETEKVQITVLNETEIVAEIETRVIEEREWKNGELVEVSRNFYVQAPDGTVCYFGEEVDDYEKGRITGHDGAWRAGVGANKPGIIMPAIPQIGQSYRQEIAPGVAMDRAEHVAFENSFTTPAGEFNGVLFVKETPASEKRYAKGIGQIFDDGMLLTSPVLR